MFERIVAAPADPILGLNEIYLQDARPHKINLGIGVYLNEDGENVVLNSVKKAERYLIEHEITKNYLPISGLPDFAVNTRKLLLGENNVIIKEKRARTAQTPGGTGALRVAADFLAQQASVTEIWISDPTWPNYNNVFNGAGIEVKTYRYYDAKTHGLDFEAMVDSLKSVKASSVILFQTCCHNPSGIDPTLEQWKILADLTAKNGWLPLFDSAYQGFAQGIDNDALPLRLFAERCPELLIANSFSKNFGLYNERIGALTIIAKNSDEAERSFGQIKASIRMNYSNPPAHGGLIVTTILSTPAHRNEWENEVKIMRERIKCMRLLFVKTLQEKGANEDFSFICQQNGMFSFSGLTKDQVHRLRNEHAIYAVDSGRINVAGMTLNNMSILCEAIVSVL